MTTPPDQSEQVQGEADRSASAPDRHTKPRKPYTKPEIIHKLALETRAGSPLAFPDPLDPFGLQLKE